MKGNPKYQYGNPVKFELNGEIKEGTVYTVDEYGTFEDDSDVSYDILVKNEKEHCLYKHINEKYILK